jgi:ribosomal protein S18 acetylase RimI-like enzyme
LTNTGFFTNSHAKPENATYIKLETAIDNYTAQRLYETIGFKKQGPGGTFFTYQIQLV